MILERRDFLKLLGLTAGSAGLGSCGRWAIPDDLVELALRGPGLSSEAQSICALCEGGCGLSVRLVDGLPVGLKGNPHHPLNRGGLCPVGQGGLEVLYSPDRLEGPLQRVEGGALEAATWDDVLSRVAGRLAALATRGQGDRLAVLVGPGDGLFEQLARAVAASVGSANVSATVGAERGRYQLGLGLDEVPAVDLAGADMVLSIGLDIFEGGPAPLQAVSALVGERSDGERARLIHVGTRLSASATKARRQIWIRPSTYPAFALGVAHVLVREGRYDRQFVDRHTLGFDDWRDDQGRERIGFRRLLLERYYPDRAAQICGVEPASIVDAARLFAEASRPVAVVGGEAVEGTNATWAVWATQSINALIGAFGREGGIGLSSPIPFRALPDEGGGSVRSASLFEPAPEGPALGVDPVMALSDHVLSAEGSIEVLLVAGCDPLRESPDADRFRQALDRIPLVVTLAPFLGETAAVSDAVLATHTPLEQWHASTTPPGVPFAVLGLAQPVIEPLYDTRSAGDVLLELSRRVSPGESALAWDSYEAYLRDRIEGVALSGEGAIVTGSFEEGWKHFLEERGWRFTERRRSEDFWRDLVQQAGWWSPVQAHGDWARLFRTPSGRFEFFSQTLEIHLRLLGVSEDGASIDDDQALARGIEVLGLQAAADEVCFPHHEPPLESGDGELTMVPFRPLTARGGLGSKSPMVLEMFGHQVLSGWETWAQLTEETAHHLNLRDGDRVAVESERATLEAVVRVSPVGSADVVHLPVGLGFEDERTRRGRVGANPLNLVAGGLDALSGLPAPASTRVRLRLLERRRHGGPAPRHGGHTA